MALLNWQEDNNLQVVMAEVGKKYELLEKLGGGGYSNVYKIYHKLLNVELALKIMDIDFLLKNIDSTTDVKEYFENIYNRFSSEARLYRRITHPNVVKIDDASFVYDEIREVSIPYLVMQFIEGKTLKSMLHDTPGLNLESVFKISMKILSAISAIHQEGVAHRDIKSANIIIKTEKQEPILIDMGLAKDLIDKSVIQQSGVSIGTAPYMSPEQCGDTREVDHRSDIYSFGVVFFEMLTGKLPFERGSYYNVMFAHMNSPVPNVREINPSLPIGIEDIIFKAIAFNPSERFQSADEFISAIENFNAALESPVIPVAKRELVETNNILKHTIEKSEQEKQPVSIPKRSPDRDEEITSKSFRIDNTDREKKKYFYYALAFLVSIAIAALLYFNPLGIGQKSKNHSQKHPTPTPASTSTSTLTPTPTATPTSTLTPTPTPASTSTPKPPPSPTPSPTPTPTAKKETPASIKKRYNKYIKDAKEFAENQEYEKAIASLKQAQNILNTEEVDQLIKDYQEDWEEKKSFERTKENLDFYTYRKFIERYPNSTYISELQTQLYEIDKNLPPVKHLNELTKNKRGYYEKTFANGHIMIYIPGKKSWIDKYEVSIWQYKNFKPVKGQSDHPVQVSYEDAEAYCKHFGFTLPTKTEWEYAAGASKGYTYPWGYNEPDEGGIYRANYDAGKQDLPAICSVTSFSEYASPFGLINMAGNASEWVKGKFLKGGSAFSREKKALRIKPGNEKKEDGNSENGFRCIKKEES